MNRALPLLDRGGQSSPILGIPGDHQTPRLARLGSIQFGEEQWHCFCWSLSAMGTGSRLHPYLTPGRAAGGQLPPGCCLLTCTLLVPCAPQLLHSDSSGRSQGDGCSLRRRPFRACQATAWGFCPLVPSSGRESGFDLGALKERGGAGGFLLG